MQHSINTSDAAPIRLSSHQLPLVKNEAAEQKIKAMVAAGVIELSSSPWAALAVLAKKKDISLLAFTYFRICSQPPFILISNLS